MPLAAGVTAATVALIAVPGMADQVRDQEWWLSALHVTQAWQATRGSGVTVAILGTGVDWNHPDLGTAVRTGPDYTRSGRSDGGPYWGIDGTAIASIIAGRGDGTGHSSGIIGVAPAAKILSLRVTLDPGDPLRSDPNVAARLPAAVAAGIRYAADHGATVIDLPLDPGAQGAFGADGSPAAAGGSAAERQAVNYALGKGAVLVAPAGDDGAIADTVDFPASYAGVISVGAFDQGFLKASFTSRRSYVTLTAPGVGIAAASPPDGYTTVSSTDASSAVVTGVVALIRSKYPGLIPSQITQALTGSTVFRPQGGSKNGSGYGTVDAARALAAAAAIALPSPSPSPQSQVARTSAAPTSAPTPPPLPSTARSIAFPLLRDAAIAAAALILLLLCIAVVTRAERRRRRAARAPAPRPRPSRALSAGSTRPQHAMDGSARSAGGSARTSGRGPEQLPSRPALGPVPRLAGTHPAQQAKPSSGPPWEPAVKPEGEPPWGPAPRPQGESPWAATPPRPLGAGRQTRRNGSTGAVNGSLWETAAGGGGAAPQPGGQAGSPGDSFPQAGAPAGLGASSQPGGTAGGFGDSFPADAATGAWAAMPGPAMPLSAPAPDGVNGQDGDAGASLDAGAGPIYVWNPGASTESFPAVSPERPGGHPDDGGDGNGR